MLPSLSLDDYLHAKNLRRNCWISSKDIDDQRILESDWTRAQLATPDQKW